MTKENKLHRLITPIILALILAGCQPAATPTPQKVIETVVVTEVVEATSVEVLQVVTPTPEPAGPRTLVICEGQEPDTLYPYGGSLKATSDILEAISEGSWSGYDSNSYAYQPTIIEKLPDLGDGDASLATVKVSEGSTVVDAFGDVVELDPAAGIMLTPAGRGEPVAYEGGEFEMDQLSATFSLLPDLLWSDGTPLTAADSVYAFKLLADPNTLFPKYSLERTATYEAIDDLTIVWTGLPGFLDSTYYLNFFGPAPEHSWGKYSAEELLTAEESSLAPIGWGPYVIDEWVQGDRVTLHKNPNYYRAAENLPKFDHLIYRFVGQNGNANIAALLSGECDILAQLTGLDDQIELMIAMQNTGQVNATFTTGTVWSLISLGIQHIDYDDGFNLNTDRPDYFSDVRTRKAFAMCIDRQALVDNLTYGQAKVIDNYLPPEHPVSNPDVIHYDFDVNAGNALLDEVGWLEVDGDPATPRVAQDIPGVPDGTELKVTMGVISIPLIQKFVEILQDS
ncbi:MAG: hypothetical protein JSV42_02480, partial [Chloroflexota bacterium]